MALGRVLHLPPALGLRSQDLGELLLAVTVAVMLLAPIAWLYRRSSAGARTATRDLLLLLGVLGFFGVCVDLLHVVLADTALRGLTVLEEGGEMVTMSVLAAHAFTLLAERGCAPASLWEQARASLLARLHRRTGHRRTGARV
jgi:hypothetical protein